jgi:hypothetical protein
VISGRRTLRQSREARQCGETRLKGDVEVDLTSACQALTARPADGPGRPPRRTTLATDRGLAEVDVSPRALADLVRKPAALY